MYSGGSINSITLPLKLLSIESSIWILLISNTGNPGGGGIEDLSLVSRLPLELGNTSDKSTGV
jgi:hypothetical protein